MKITSRLSSSNAIAFNGKRKRTMRKHVANPVDSKFDTWWEKTKQKQKNRRTISNSVSSIIRDLCSIQGEGGEHRRAFFFLLVTYPAGKIGGRRGKGKRGEGCACFAKARVDEPRSWEHGDTKFRSACYFPRHSGKCSREGFPREAINLHPNRGNHYFHRGMAHLQSKQINPLRAMNI